MADDNHDVLVKDQVHMRTPAVPHLYLAAGWDSMICFSADLEPSRARGDGMDIGGDFMPNLILVYCVELAHLCARVQSLDRYPSGID